MAFNGALLKQWRRSMGLSQASAAENIQCSQRFWQGLEAGTKQPSIETLESLMSFTGLCANELIDANPTVPRKVARQTGSQARESGNVVVA